MNSNAHVPVLLGPVLKGLEIKTDGVYVDATFGRGGHSGAILQQLNANGRLVALDRDPHAIASLAPALRDDPRLTLIRSDFAELAKHISAEGLAGRVNGLLFDLGVSSPQLDEAERGFSFLRDGPLDMRMDPDSGISAAEWLNSTNEKTLKRVLYQFGEERDAPRIARAIVNARQNARIETTAELAAVVSSVIPAHTRKKHPATKTFQAIRIVVNKELEQLQSALAQSVDLLAKGGRLCVISFHSLEDRIVKRFIRSASRETEQYRGMPDVPAEFRPKLRQVGKVITASADEIAANVRARSARLRIAEHT
ncbi:MAG: 16S rRNA (cytosine(1402)-N(4))-methyltransferase RsmH [Gammaproteobacteria bacterium]|nr:16S rRNA (cytosine(1402)-N(4))-methyltransferase RsmH [Gammaproteobacteria bacterium]